MWPAGRHRDRASRYGHSPHRGPAAGGERSSRAPRPVMTVKEQEGRRGGDPAHLARSGASPNGLRSTRTWFVGRARPGTGRPRQSRRPGRAAKPGQRPDGGPDPESGGPISTTSVSRRSRRRDGQVLPGGRRLPARPRSHGPALRGEPVSAPVGRRCLVTEPYPQYPPPLARPGRPPALRCSPVWWRPVPAGGVTSGVALGLHLAPDDADDLPALPLRPALLRRALDLQPRLNAGATPRPGWRSGRPSGLAPAGSPRVPALRPARIGGRPSASRGYRRSRGAADSHPRSRPG